jgi:inner membrane protein
VASLGHIAVGLAAGRLYEKGERRAKTLALFVGLSLLPDADVIGFRLGVAYADPFGHRGASHSFLFAVGMGLLLGLLWRAQGRELWRTFLFVTATVASHGVLDTLTNGGLGVGLLWPFSMERFFAPWRPIPVAPLAPQALASLYGLWVLMNELIFFSPFLLYVLWPRPAMTQTKT